jgi:hypothetical protein
MLYHNSGGEIMRIVKRCTDWCGGNFAILRVREVLVLEISTSLTCLCLQNRFGDLLMRQSVYVQRFYVQNIAHMEIT